METQNLLNEFKNLTDPLQSYLYRLTASKEDTEDLIQETWIRIQEKSNQFNGNSSFKTWAFAIATNLARDLRRTSIRWAENAQDKCKEAAQQSEIVQQEMKAAYSSQTEQQFELIQHLDYCFICMTKTLSQEEQITVILKEMYEFSRLEIAGILNRTEGAVKHYLFNGRRKLQEAYNRRCALVSKQGACYQCAQLNDYFQEVKNSDEKIKQTGLSHTKTSVENFKIRLNLIRNIHPITGNGTDLKETLFRILREGLGE